MPIFSRLAVVVLGFAAGRALAKRWQESEPAPLDFHRPRAALSPEIRLQVMAYERRIRNLESQVRAHEAQLREVPAQIHSEMDAILTKATDHLDERLTLQAQSIDALQQTVTQTDELLERVLESLDLLRGDPSEPAA